MDHAKISDIRAQGYFLPDYEKLLYQRLACSIEKINGGLNRVAKEGIIRKEALVEIEMKMAELVDTFEKHGLYI